MSKILIGILIAGVSAAGAFCIALLAELGRYIDDVSDIYWQNADPGEKEGEQK